MNRRGFIYGGLLTAMAGGCTPLQWDNANSVAYIERKDTDDGDVELILNTVDVWDSHGREGSLEELTIEGEKMLFRPLSVDFLEKAWMRVGLFWHSRQKKIMLTVVALGPNVNIRKMRLQVGGSYTTASPAKNFTFSPAKRLYDSTLSSQAFAVKPSFINLVAKEEESAVLTLMTNRGQLRGDLLAVPNKEPTTLRNSAKFLFSEFSEQYQKVVAAT